MIHSCTIRNTSQKCSSDSWEGEAPCVYLCVHFVEVFVLARRGVCPRLVNLGNRNENAITNEAEHIIEERWIHKAILK